MRPINPPTCHHDGEAGTLANGKPRCPMCRRLLERAQRAAAAPRPSLDVKALAAGDDTTLELWEGR